MNALYKTLPTGELKQNPAAAFRLTEEGPVVVMSKATPKVVMVAPDEWNQIANRLAFFERQAEGDRAIAADDWVTCDELDAEFAKMGLA